MFPGRSNNTMLKLQMDTSGRFPNRMLKRHLASYVALFGPLWPSVAL